MEGWRLPSGGLPTSLRAPFTSDKQVATKGNICLALAIDKNWRRGLPRAPTPLMSSNREKKILRRHALTTNMEGHGKGVSCSSGRAVVYRSLFMRDSEDPRRVADHFEHVQST